MKFIEQYELNKLAPANYNPRKITDSGFNDLCSSITTFGVIKPVILNGNNGVLTAGHQRVKALKHLGFSSVPAIILDKISLHDEIKFNLLHNSIETSKSVVYIKNITSKPMGFSIVNVSEIDYKHNNSASVIKEICALINKHGPWGSVVVNESGKVIHNSDYAVASRLMAEQLLIYKISNDKVDTFIEYMSKDYGEYNYDTLGVKSYNQIHCQMNRLRTNTESGKSFKSTTYEEYILPELKKTDRLIDFGAGKLDYVKLLNNMGYNAFGYEPNFIVNGSTISIKEVVKQILALNREINSNGLFNKVVLDSVINSVVSLDFEHHVLMTCNSLCADNGIFYTGTRNIESVYAKSKLKTTYSNERLLEFLDANGFSATFRHGAWTLQKFHSVESLRKLLSKYFYDVKIYRPRTMGNIYGVCRQPIRFSVDKYKESLNAEFNMEYKGGYKHNKHDMLVSTILKLLSNGG